MSITMIAPAGVSGIVNGNAANYTIGADGTITNVASGDLLALLRAGFRLFSTFINRVFISSPLPADLVSIVAAVDDVASTATVDTVARTIASTTAPANNGLVDYDFTYSWGVPA